jgi:hypothetical protein
MTDRRKPRTRRASAASRTSSAEHIDTAAPARGAAKRAAALAPDVAAGAPDQGYRRPAGPEAMRDPPPEWDEVDEAVDESFPASDPPSFHGVSRTRISDK